MNVSTIAIVSLGKDPYRPTIITGTNYLKEECFLKRYFNQGLFTDRAPIRPPKLTTFKLIYKTLHWAYLSEFLYTNRILYNLLIKNTISQFRSLYIKL